MTLPANPVDVSVILICWNSLQLTSEAIRTLLEHTAGVSYEVIVVDNGSTQFGEAAELARRFPQVQVIANAENRGFAIANNQGIAVARGRYVLLLNSDTLQIENAIGRAVNYMDVCPDVGILGVAHRNGDPGRSHQPSTAAFPTPLRGIRGIISGLFAKPSLQPLITPPIEGNVDWVTGSFFLIRRACLEQVGPLDERFFVYAEDIDWCFQARKHGWVVRFWPDVSIVHFGSSSAFQLADKTFMIYRNQLEFFRKNFSPLAVLAFYAIMSARLGFSTLHQVVKWILGQAEWGDVRVRWQRQLNFTTLQSDRRGLIAS